MKLILFAIIFLHSAYALSQSQTIIVREQFAGYGYYQGSKEIPNDGLEVILRSNREAFKMLKSVESEEGFYTFIGAVGGALIGWPLGTWIAGGDPEWILAAVGGGLIVATMGQQLYLGRNSYIRNL